ncbi:testicular haploid expressed gene protein-like isoform X1 [Mercenaria mercenaria]|uniref:testicular haploid expressed gene protein-like isoform X1 n=1 Tax=Mercenaria mercenaria TaxID=6596 RepID=UPI00234F82AC|nr:testicular haploid expressed gene protein-like isoform X1 [Mercenaria mercenaria]
MATATEGQSGSRIEQLAKPKRVPPEFLEDRRSVYWVDYVPPRPGPNGQTEIIATPRVQELARHRPPSKHWMGDRITPMWPVSDEAKNAPTTERIMLLSRHKTFYDHKLERSPYMSVSDSAKRATPSQRLEQLAVPKQRQDRFGIYETEWGQYNPVSPAAMKASHTERIESLAQSKGYHKNFQDERSIQWTVGNSALNAIATLRMQQLARPRSRTMIRDDYDPYRISPSAKRARCTPRIDELCVPLPRKVRQKKVV